ncbi:MAG: hypothetical protein KAU17_12360 [Spirochaetales bacterium]|nr:hypothetical protein [Spirochaetales bacterium]
MEILKIDDITEVPSDIHYIKKFIARIKVRDFLEYEFYLGFSIEYRAVGGPEVILKFIDKPSDSLLAHAEELKALIIELDRKGKIKSTYEPLVP